MINLFKGKTRINKAGILIGFLGSILGLYMFKQLMLVFPLEEGVGHNIEIAIYFATILLPALLTLASIFKNNEYVVYLAFFISLPIRTYVDMVEISFILDFITFSYLISAIFITLKNRDKKAVNKYEEVEDI